MQTAGCPKSITAREIAELPLTIPSRPNTIRMQVETRLARLGLHPRIAIEVNAIAVLLDLVAEGIDSAILPQVTIRGFDRLEDFSLRLITAPGMHIDLCWAVSSRRPVGQLQSELIKIIQSIVPDLIAPDG